MICITFINAQKDTKKIICLVNLILQSLLNVLAIIFILSFSPDLAEGGKSPVSVARGGEMLGMSVWCQSPLTAHRLVPGSGWADWAPNTGHRARARSSSSDSGSVLGGGSARHQHHLRIE